MPRLIRSPVLWSLGAVAVGLAALFAGAGLVQPPPAGDAQSQATISIRKLTTGSAPTGVTYTFALTCAEGSDTLDSPVSVSLTAGQTQSGVQIGTPARCTLTETNSRGATSVSGVFTTPQQITGSVTFTVTNNFPVATATPTGTATPAPGTPTPTPAPGTATPTPAPAPGAATAVLGAARTTPQPATAPPPIVTEVPPPPSVPTTPEPSATPPPEPVPEPSPTPTPEPDLPPEPKPPPAGAPAPPEVGAGLAARELVWPGAIVLALILALAAMRRRRAG